MVVSRKDVVGYMQNSFEHTTGDEGAKAFNYTENELFIA